MEFERDFGRLRPDERTAFIADLWSARGYETTRDERTVVATDPETGTETCIRLLQAGGSQSSTDAVPSNVDVLVAGSQQVAEQIDQFDARALDASDLRIMVLYAIAREGADHLTRQYFGKPVSMLVPAEDSTAKDSTAEDSTAKDSTAEDGQADTSVVARHSLADALRMPLPSPRIRLGLVLLVAVFILVGVIIGGTTGDPSYENGDRWAFDGGSPTEDTAAAVTGFPPGLGPGGITNLTRLVRTHRRTVEAKPYHLVVRHNGSRGQVVTNARWVSSRQTVSVGRDRSYYRVVGTIPPKTVGGSSQRLSFVEYRTGVACKRDTSVALDTDRETPTGCEILDEGEVAERFARLAGTYLRRYLDTSTSTVQVVRAGNESQYRVTATGNSFRISADVTGYRAIATVDRSGLVMSLRVEYTWQRPDGSRRIRFEFQYTKIEDSTT